MGTVAVSMMKYTRVPYINFHGLVLSLGMILFILYFRKRIFLQKIKEISCSMIVFISLELAQR